MPTLTIKKDVDFPYIEECLDRLMKSDFEQIRVPSSIKFSGGFGVEAALVQLISTWARKNTEGSLKSYVKQDDDNGFSKLCESLYGLLSLTMSPYVLYEDGTRISKSISMDSAKPMMKALGSCEFSSAFKGKKVFVPCLKSGGYDGRISPLYENREIISDRKFFNVFKKMFIAVIPEKNRREKIPEEYIRSVSYITRQLFLNTHEHAMYDESGNEYIRNSRGVSVKLNSYNKDELSSIKFISGISIADEYEECFHEYLVDGRQIHVLEVSVFDAGPGFAGRWLGNKAGLSSVEDRVVAVLSCFEKYKGTKSQSSSGQGLNLVIDELIRRNGFFRLRTGDILVEKSFVGGAGGEGVLRSDLKSMTAMSSGSVFTFVVPVL